MAIEADITGSTAGTGFGFGAAKDKARRERSARLKREVGNCICFYANRWFWEYR